MFLLTERLQLQKALESILGSNAVYFQPPPKINMIYPCIIYRRIDISSLFADNRTWRMSPKYQITYVDKNPDADVPERLMNELGCSFDRAYSAENLNHTVLTLNF